MSKTILVTGSAGFIGFHLTQRLLKLGHRVIGIDDFNDYYDVSLKQRRNKILQEYSNYHFIRGDIADNETLTNIFKIYSFEIVYHLAAQAGVRYSITNPMIYEKNNIYAFLNICECIRNFKVKRLVYASSSSVYGNIKTPKNGYIENDMNAQPVSLYGATKVADEAIAYAYSHLYKFQSVGLRFFTVYGPWGRPDMAYYIFANAIEKGLKVKLFNSGFMKRDFTFIDDVVQVMEHLIDIKLDNKHEIFNISGTKQYTVFDLVAGIEKHLGKKAIIVNEPIQKGDMLETLGNCEKAKKLLKFRPKTTLDKGIKEFVDWYKKYYYLPKTR